MYVYIKSEPQLWTVGFYDPSAKWQSESDHGSAEDAADRVAYLNGAVTKKCEHIWTAGKVIEHETRMAQCIKCGINGDGTK